MRIPAAFVLLAASACATPVEDPGMTPQTAVHAQAQSATFALRTRDHKITFFTGDRMTVEDTRGTVLARLVTMEELESLDPFLYAACRNATAKNGTYLDARLDHEPSSDTADHHP